jgi:hypothetical protein
VELEISGAAEQAQAAEQTALFYIRITLCTYLINEAASNSEYILMASNNRFDSK